MKEPTRQNPFMKLVSIRLPESLLKRAKIRAVESGTTLQGLVAEAITLFLKSRKDEEDQS